jgi:lysophospholipase L1-like esterase
MGRAGPAGRGVLVAAVTSVVVALLVLYVVDAAGLLGDGTGGPTGRTDAERRAAAARTAGPYRTAVDPWVGITMKAETTREILGAAASTDAFGQRVRVGPPEEPGATRIVVLGDSVAFGFGLADDETIGSALEELLASASAGGPRPVVRTVASPGWNARNAFRYLTAHLGRLRPDVVLFLPVGNDLDDGFSTDETGQKSPFDLARGARLPAASLDQWHALMRAHQDGAGTGRRQAIRRAGGVDAAVPHALFTGLTPESDRRWGEQVAGLAELQRRLASHGARLAVTFLEYQGYESVFHARVGRALPELPLVRTFAELGPGDQLGDDPHPNARYARALAWCMAELLVREGWVPDARADRLPPLDEDLADRRLPALDLAGAEALLASRAAPWAEFFESEVVLADTTGFQQVYGGVAADGTVERALWLALAGTGGTELTLEIERLPAATRLYPLTLRAVVDGAAAGEVEVPAPAEGADPAFTHTFRVPADRASLPYLDVEVHASNWVHDPGDGRSRNASFRLVRIGLGPG